jgi:hypothetical protein
MDARTATTLGCFIFLLSVDFLAFMHSLPENFTTLHHIGETTKVCAKADRKTSILVLIRSSQDLENRLVDDPLGACCLSLGIGSG